jgi:uncharacterized protein
MEFRSLTWEWPDRRGLEHLVLSRFVDGTKADGLVVVDAADGVIRFRYSISYGSGGELRRCLVIVPNKGSQKMVRLELGRDGSWMVDRTRRADLTDCVAFDIKNTPFPKTGIVRTLDLREGESTSVPVVAVDDQTLTVTRVVQRWGRLSQSEQGLRQYRCETPTGVLELTIDRDGFLLWSRRWRSRDRKLWQPALVDLEASDQDPVDDA